MSEANSCVSAINYNLPLPQFFVKTNKKARIRENGAGADMCVACGACEAACTQHLPIIEQLRQAWTELG